MQDVGSLPNPAWISRPLRVLRATDVWRTLGGNDLPAVEGSAASRLRMSGGSRRKDPYAVFHQSFSPESFLNRELSWLEFNARVLEEAEDASNPLLERVKFLSIFSSNLDEFFMVRVAGLREQAFGDGAPQDYSPDGLRAITQLQRIAKRTQELVAAQYRCWNESVVPQLAQADVRFLKYEELNPEQRELIG